MYTTIIVWSYYHLIKYYITFHYIRLHDITFYFLLLDIM